MHEMVVREMGLALVDVAHAEQLLEYADSLVRTMGMMLDVSHEELQSAKAQNELLLEYKNNADERLEMKEFAVTDLQKQMLDERRKSKWKIAGGTIVGIGIGIIIGVFAL